MGNIGSSSAAPAAAAAGGGNGRRRNQSHNHNAPETGGGNRYIFAAAVPYAQYPNPNSPQYYNYAPPPTPSAQLPAPLDNRHQGWRNPYFPTPPAAAAARIPFVEHQKAVTIRNDVNLKKESLVIEKDEENPDRYLVGFTFDAVVAGSITVLFFAKESFTCNLEPMKETSLAPVTVTVKIGLGQKFKQPPGTGIDLSMFEEFEFMKEGETEVYPLAIKAESWAINKEECAENKSMVSPSFSHITQAVFEKKENGEYKVRVVKQMLWVNGKQFELQEIYGIGNSVDGDFDESDPGKECVVCLSEVRNTTVLPCRHMCLCSECAKVLRFQTNRCPVCRQPVDRLLEIMVNDGGEDHLQAPRC